MYDLLRLVQMSLTVPGVVLAPSLELGAESGIKCGQNWAVWENPEGKQFEKNWFADGLTVAVLSKAPGPKFGRSRDEPTLHRSAAKRGPVFFKFYAHFWLLAKSWRMIQMIQEFSRSEKSWRSSSVAGLRWGEHAWLREPRNVVQRRQETCGPRRKRLDHQWNSKPLLDVRGILTVLLQDFFIIFYVRIW